MKYLIICACFFAIGVVAASAGLGISDWQTHAITGLGAIACAAAELMK